MTIYELTDRNAVLQAITEFDSIGATSFYSKYRYGPPNNWFMTHENQDYPLKAIIGAAHSYQFPEIGALDSEAFGSGAAAPRAEAEQGDESCPPSNENRHRT